MVLLWQAVFALLLVVVDLCFSLEYEARTSLARGFNDNIHWVNLEDGMKLVQLTNKPGMILLHKSWCKACKRLKPLIVQSKEMEQLSRDFVMINIQDEEEPADDTYQPDGGYIPRILFVRPNGDIMYEIYNMDGNDKFKYFYGKVEYIIKSMRRVKRLHTTPVDEL